MIGLYVLVAVYAAVLVGTVVRQVPAISSSRLLAWDTLGVLPGFSFFAPHPGSHDYTLIYRTARDGIVDRWHDPFRLSRRSPWTAVWNPGKRLRKAIIDASGALAHEMVSSPEGDPRVVLSVPYLLLLHFVSELAGEGATHVQFAVLVSPADDGSHQAELLMLSEMHGL